MARARETKFVVVEFNENIDDEPVVDLVPVSWVDEENQECWYPENTTAKKIRKWVSQEKKPSSNWKKYSIAKIISRARDFEQGIRRFERALNFNDEQTTDADSVQGERIEVLSAEQVSNTLDQTDILPVIGDITLANLLDGNLSTMTLINQTLPSEAIGPMPHSSTDTGLWKEELLAMESRLARKIDGAKRSILYDINRKIDELKNTLALTLLPTQSEAGDTANSARAQLNDVLPITTQDAFIEFDGTIAVSEDKRNALKNVITSLTFGSSNVKSALSRTMPALISKDVQIKYSACGRKTKNSPGKFSFAATNTFKCIRDVFQTKFPTEEASALLSHLSRWLAGAGDREGGRAIRMSSCNDNINNNNA